MFPQLRQRVTGRSSPHDSFASAQIISTTINPPHRPQAMERFSSWASDMISDSKGSFLLVTAHPDSAVDGYSTHD
jgi:hypothetical protein